MTLNITHRFELQKLIFLDADAEAAVRFNQNFVEPQGVDPDILHQTCIVSDYSRISAGNAMQDFDEVSLQLLLIGSSLAQHHQPFDWVKVPALLRL